MKNYMIGIVVLFSTMILGSQKINTTKSGVTFEIGNMRINTVEGSFKGMKGEVNFDADNLKVSSFNATIDVSTVETGIEKRDNHLRAEDFFYVEKYPTIKFKSDAVVKSKKEGYYIAKGKLTIRDVTKDVKIPFTYKNGTFEGTFKVDRFDYNVGVEMNTTMVSKVATVTIRCIAK